jgi:Xaa-Pro aminopeptidase
MLMDIPFDQVRLDALLDDLEVGAVLVCSKHNVQYLLGGYRYFFFAHSDAIGISRYLPILGYVKGRPECSFYIGAGNEDWGTQVSSIWVTKVVNRAWTPRDAALIAADLIKSAGIRTDRIAVEPAFLTLDAAQVLRTELSNPLFVDATLALEELRAVKTAVELEHIRIAAEALADSMLATFTTIRSGMTEREVVERVRQEQTERGLDFDYALITSGPTFGRAPSERRIRSGEVISLDTAGYQAGYLADMARMAVLGKPTVLMKKLLDEIQYVQKMARAAVAAGKRGGEIYEIGRAAVRECEHWPGLVFVAHGMGLIPHEAPHLTAEGEIPYPGTHVNRPLEAGMVLSIETGIKHPEVGFVKLEDTIVVTETGSEAYGDWGRDWNIAGNNK